ncbi:DUF4160 domain-containing protein [Aquimarina celericrescens]|uniref:DUF4160 domain-containing protein n=1 Tax=Aquimarina celericrescens TaxID=1964542 RepID=A0ABW5AXI4_9FLAO|nr:DUF4160 domain-containing protein [Aquimarina celericrescens]
MSLKIFETILQDLLEYYLVLDDVSLQKHLNDPTWAIKERVATIDDLQVKIYPNDHNPPHFHVVSKNKEIDAKFTIEKCDLISGNMSSKNLKKINAFYQGMKGKMVLETIWKKYHGDNV